ncbi:cysteine hydrolase family protein [Bacillus cytotoxicus]|uniref:Isochorismatase hydrolase n=2 Tax=Bacillus cytotoxicus TaxID=580165 RepID=A0AAX2CCD8_9BACI|nr:MULTISPECIES: cysteine hydrolase family protein [Bacillus cereus group]ABS20653.1 isochorismatase hydrolase [Bacillus cytotoxicus NVH 391-98]AWC27287.1 cysteine hydrolase [Bacillus cytotoxicus]AWC31324.1 cysteine hydrolase [Bacillus cytotoxicus]AWC35365.1 cysteine hydrolase [Bacillus cytotoxicus]AWC39400.1 cysteine hydrolase [Bacillus cytotoxicus]
MKTALLLVDIQNDYFPNGKMELRNAVEASEYARQLLQYFRQTNQPIFHIQHVSFGDHATFFLPNTEGVHIHESVRPLQNETVILKHYPNSFRETNLLQKLQKLKIERIIICGMMTHMCIDATVRAAFDFGFHCTVIHDACATKDLLFKNATIPAVYIHNTILASLNEGYADVISTEEFLPV